MKVKSPRPGRVKQKSQPKAGRPLAEKVKNKKEKDLDKFRIPLKQLLEAGSHFGHQVRRWNPKMTPFIYCARDGVHIFDLAKTANKLAEACVATKELVAEGGTIVFVGTKRQAQTIIKEEAVRSGVPYIVIRWLGGTISNWSQIEKSIHKLIEMEKKKEEGEYEKYTKKENILINREIARLKRFFGGLTNLKKVPEALFVVDVNREKTAISEAREKGVKIFALVDSNVDPTFIDYPIPANDDAVGSIKLIVSTFAKAVGEGMELREKKEKK